MLSLSRVVWSEGMHLAQHHFQAQSRYFENSIQFALSHLFFKPYGLAGCELDVEALRNGTVSLVHARGVMPDGLAFHFPDGDPLPKARHIRDLFLPTQESHLLYLTIPPYRPEHSNCLLEDEAGDAARYKCETSLVLDETTGRDEKAVDVGHKNFRLMLDLELPEDLVSLPLARVRRDGAGQFIYDPEYVPPCLQIGASARLMETLRRLIEILEARTAALADERHADPRSLAEYATHDVASFWLSHTIHSSLAPLRHHLQVKRSRPDEVYTELVRLAGALCTFSLESHPGTLPLYDHEHLEECFSALDRHIRSHLEIIIPTNRVSVRLERQRAYLYVGELGDPACFGPSQWILGVGSSAGEAEVISRVPELVKVCSAEYIARIVKEARAGLPLEHLPVAPPAISPRIGMHYFLIKKEGGCWQAIQKSEDIGIYVPKALPETELELTIVLEGGSGSR